MDSAPLRPRHAAAAVLIAGWAAMLALSAPGQLSYDSVTQLADGRSGNYNSWHPPVMAWLLGVFDRLVPGTILFLIFMSGLGLVALLWLLWLKPDLKSQEPGWGAAIAALMIVLTPQWLLYQGEIWKDVLFANAALAGFAALARAAADWPARRPWLAAAALLLILAAMARQNGMVLLPVAAVTLALTAVRHGDRRTALGYGAGFLLLTGVGAFGTNAALTLRGDGGDGAAAELRFVLAYDLTGALAKEPSLKLPLLKQSDPKLETLLRRRGVPRYSTRQLDSFMDDPATAEAIGAAPGGAIFTQWRAFVLTRPAFYLAMRWPVFWQVLATPDVTACHPLYVGVSGPPEDMKALGLMPRLNFRDRTLAAYAGRFIGTPLFSHLAFALLAVALMALFLRRGTGADIAMAGLLAGALVFALTFLIVSVACDYRYLHLLDIAALTGAFRAAHGFSFPQRRGT